MADYHLPKFLRNAVLKEITDRHLIPSDFTWDTHVTRSDSGDRIAHRPTGYFFAFMLSSRQFWSTWMPPSATGETSTVLNGEADQLDAVSDWLDYVRREAETPDLWESIANEAELVTGDVADENRQFTAVEQRQIVERLTEIEAFLTTTRSLSETQQRWVHVRIEYVAEAATRLSVKDWKNIFLAGLTQLIIGLALDPRSVHELFAMAVRHIGPLLGTIGGLLR